MKLDTKTAPIIAIYKHMATIKYLISLSILILVGCAPRQFCYDNKCNAVNKDQNQTVRSESGICVYQVTAGVSSVYIVEQGNSIYIIDAGWPGSAKTILKRVHDLGPEKRIRLIFITHGHFDHYGSAFALRKMTDAPIAIHADDARAMQKAQTPIKIVRSWGILGRMFLPLGEFVLHPKKTSADIIVQDGDRLDNFGIKAQVLHTPGHTPGSCCLIVDDSLAFVGDLVSTTVHPYSQCYFADSWEQIALSLDILKKQSPAYLFLGHATRPYPRSDLINLKPYLPKKHKH